MIIYIVGRYAQQSSFTDKRTRYFVWYCGQGGTDFDSPKVLEVAKLTWDALEIGKEYRVGLQEYQPELA